MSVLVSSTAGYEDYDKGDIWWYCWRLWSREVLRWSFPTLAIKCLVHFHPPSPSDDSYLSLKRTKECPFFWHDLNHIKYMSFIHTKYEVIDFCWRHPLKRDFIFTSSRVERLSLGSKNFHQWWETSQDVKESWNLVSSEESLELNYKF